MKKILIMLAVTLLVVSTFASCKLLFPSTTDGNGSGSNKDAESLDTEKYIPIVWGGEAKITIVRKYANTHGVFDALTRLNAVLSQGEATVREEYIASNDSNKYEILIGDGIYASDEYYVDPHTLGNHGYIVKAVGNKIVIAGGNDMALAAAIDAFVSEALMPESSDFDPDNIAMARDKVISFTENYSIKNILVSGRSISGYKIVADIGNDAVTQSAELLQNVIYNKSGYWLDIAESSAEPSIRLNLNDDAGEDGFRMYTDGYDLVIDCAIELLLFESVETLINDHFISSSTGICEFNADTDYRIHIATISYCGYGGAVGDGVADDFEAIRRTHYRANITGQTVVADAGKTFNLGRHDSSIYIMTDTVWTDARFIIDDSEVQANTSVAKTSVFRVDSDNRELAISGLTSLAAGQENIGLTLDTDALIYLYNDNNKQYIRYGSNQDSGASQQEIILVDKDGNVDPSTPIMWDYDTVTRATYKYVDDEPITITGGHITTIANRAPSQYTYYKRGITVTRSNVTFDGLVHIIEGEGDTGAPYDGFLNIGYCNNVLFRNLKLSGHKRYWLDGSNNTNAMGTYDISANASNNITWLNCTQLNSITDTNLWGIMGSNYCKNLTYDGCTFSRFDAHKGTHNARIVNSEIGHQNLSVIGSGTLIVENTTVHGNTLINLRNDYGSTWNGDVIIKNVKLINTGNVTLFKARWYNHYFGYTCHLPENITIDGIELSKKATVNIFPSISTSALTSTVNPYVMPKTVTILDIGGYTYRIASGNTSNFSNTAVTEK